MAYEPAMSGEIPMEGMLDVLRQIEERRISGRLRFTAQAGEQKETGEVELVAGQLALDQDPLPDGTDPVERLLELRGGIFVVHQRLPPLAVAQGDDQNKRGSLAVHAPTDLMTYCEQGGLTGTLRLINAGSLVEMVYEAGELLGIRVDGQDNADLSHVFSWEDGRFEIGVGRDVRSLVPGGVVEDPTDREPTTQFVRPGANDTGKHFLKVLEVALTDIVDRRERAQHKGKGQTVRPALPSVRPRPKSVMPPAAKPRRDATVRLVILGHDDDAVASAIDRSAGRPANAKRAAAREEKIEAREDEAMSDDETEAPEATTTEAEPAEQDAEPEATASEDRAEDEVQPEPAATKKKPEPEAAAVPAKPPAVEETWVGTLGWMAVVVVLGIGILAVLAKLPM